MSVEREELIYELLDIAVDLDDAARRKFLATRSAADSSLLSEGVIDEVSALLAAHDRACEERFLQEPLLPSDEGIFESLLAGQRFDGYEILSFIGAGGMGE